MKTLIIFLLIAGVVYAGDDSPTDDIEYSDIVVKDGKAEFTKTETLYDEAMDKKTITYTVVADIKKMTIDLSILKEEISGLQEKTALKQKEAALLEAALLDAKEKGAK